MKRVLGIILMAVVAIFQVQSEERPNIIVILADDLGYNDVSYNGATEIQTPVIDALAHGGVIFKNGYVTQPFCGPSRAGLITGRHQARFGMDHNIDHAPADPTHGLPLTEKTFATRLKAVGYRTGMLGKWHMGSAAHFQPLQRGFDYFYGFLGGGHNYFPKDVDFRGNSYKIPMQENHGLGEFDEYLTTELSKQAVGFIERNQDDPFLLYVAYNAPHAPLEAPQEVIDKYAHVEDPERRIYLAMIDVMDQGIGLIVEALKEQEEYENTLIFFLSDNGGVFPESWLPTFDWADNTPFRRGKASLLEGGVHVPFIAHWPKKIEAGQEFDGLVSALDIAATSVAISGAPSDSLLDGVNLEPYFTGKEKGSPNEVLYWRYDNGVWAIRTPEYKYMHHGLPGVGTCFFDMKNDPYEKENILNKRPQEQAELASLWNIWNAKNINNILQPVHIYKKDAKALYEGYYQGLLEKSQEREVYMVE